MLECVLIDSFYGVFDERLKKLKKRLKEHLSLARKDRDKKTIKSLLKEARELRNILKKLKKEHKCPNCGCVLPDEIKHT